MVYNKFKQGFLRNFLAYVMMALFLAITILLVVFDDNPIRITASIVAFVCLMMFFVYDLFFSEAFIFNKDCFCTNKYPYNGVKYAPKLFKKTSIKYNEITKIEKRLWNNRQFLLIILIEGEEPLQYIFAHEDTRDFVYNKLLELTKR